MNILTVGKYCTQCRQPEYLPIKCLKCGNKYCSLHIGHHNCMHITNIRKENKVKYKCSYKKCKISYNNVVCRYCKKIMCISHKCPKKHKCRYYLLYTQFKQNKLLLDMLKKN